MPYKCQYPKFKKWYKIFTKRGMIRIKGGSGMEENTNVSTREWEERELLHQQLKLLAERSKNVNCEPKELIGFSEQMATIYSVLQS